MGKPIQKKWFGLASLAGGQIIVNGVKFADGTTATNAYIIKQSGSDAYVVQDTAKSHAPEIVFMVNATSTGALNPGECFITATPFGGSARPCKKIAQYRVDIFEADGSVNSYSWSTQPANALGQADLITAVQLGLPINTVLPVISGTLETGSEISTTNGTWTGDPTITYTYLWLRDGEESGVTTQTFIPGGGWSDTMVSVRVTATNGAGSTTVVSAEVGPIVPAA